ncbi:MAG: hypothetical protein IT460_03635 [Planctomycetes bacterium]|nr:hypothetical protein [Planctomycetota bacterium]
MSTTAPETVVAQYRVRADREAEFRALLERHEPTLRRLGLAVGAPTQRFRGHEREGLLYVEIFTWRDAAAVEAAHRHPEVAAIWDAMEPCLEARGGKPKWDFPHVSPLP